jgi:hypothetical protein
MASNAFLTISVNKKGKITRVRRGREVVRSKKGRAAAKARVGAKKVGAVVLELFIHAPIVRGPVKKKGGGKGKGKGRGGTDPCCFRDARTGQVWCWC